MANLLEQMNVLKGLSDEALNGELNQPSGAAPPYLVLTEVQRRKDMRERYDGEKARQRRRTTVMEDLAGPVAMPPAAMGVLSAGGIAEVPGFASGGIIDYSDIADRYNSRLGELAGEKGRARAMALIAAGAGIMGGGHSNTLQNIGLGAQAGINAYSDAIKTVDSEELSLLRGLTDIGQLQEQLSAAEEDRALRREELDYRIAQDRDPASVRETRAYMGMTPEEQAVHDRLHPNYNPNSVTNDMRLVQQANDVYDNALKSLPEDTLNPDNFNKDPLVLARERQKQAAMLAYPQWVALLGQMGASAMAKQYGLSDGDILLLANPVTAAVQDKDPLGLGL